MNPHCTFLSEVMLIHRMRRRTGCFQACTGERSEVHVQQGQRERRGADLVSGREGGLFSSASRSTKDNLTLPVGLLPRLPIWHLAWISPLLSRHVTQWLFFRIFLRLNGETVFLQPCQNYSHEVKCAKMFGNAVICTARLELAKARCKETPKTWLTPGLFAQNLQNIRRNGSKYCRLN